MLKKISDYLLLIFLFLLPWQTRYIWQYGELNHGYFEYGTFSIYATEILLWIILILFFVQHYFKKEFFLGLKNKPPRIFLLLLLLFLGISVALSSNFWVSYNFIFRILEAMAFFVVLSSVIPPARPVVGGSEPVVVGDEGTLSVIPRLGGVGVGETFSGQSDQGCDYTLGSSPLPTLPIGGIETGQRFTPRGIFDLLRRRNDKYALALWAGAVLQGGLAVYQFLTQHVWASKWLGMASQEAKNLGPSVIEFADQRWLRAYGSFGSPNSLGIYLAILFVLGLVLYLKTERARTKILISVGQVLILSGLLVSYSRAAWLAAVAGTISLFIVLIFKHHRHQSSSPLLGERQREGYSAYNDTRTNTPPLAPPLKGEGGHDDAASSLPPTTGRAGGMTTLKAFAKQVGFAVAVVIFWLVIFYPVFTARFNLANRLEVKSISERKGQYSEALSFIKSNPIFGVGPGAYTYALYKKYPTLQSWEYQPIHNIYLLALVEVGLAGFIFLFFLCTRLFWMVIKTNLVYVPVLVVLVLAGVFDHWLWSMYTGMVFFWIIFALGLIYKTEPTE